MKLEMQRFSVQIGVFELKELLTPSTAMSYKRNEVMYIEIYLAIQAFILSSIPGFYFLAFNLTELHLIFTLT